MSMAKRKPLPKDLLPLDARHFYIRDHFGKPVGVIVVLQRYDMDGYDLGCARCNFDAGDTWDRAEGIRTALFRARDLFPPGSGDVMTPICVMRKDIFPGPWALGRHRTPECILRHADRRFLMSKWWGLSERNIDLNHIDRCLAACARHLHLFLGEPAPERNVP